MRLLSRLLPLVALTAACSASLPTDKLAFQPAGPDHAPDPSTFGPYAVGVRTVTLTDATRKFEGKERPLVTEIWYPADESARGKPGVTYDIKTVLTDEQRAAVTQFDVPLLETTAVRDAALFPGADKYPLIIFSHGQGGVRWQSTFYTVTLASHGYIVVSTDHPGNTLDYLIRDGLSNTLEGILHRPKDASALIDYFTEEDEKFPAGFFLAGRVDADAVGITGHSFGAITSFATAYFDDRVKAMVPQAPGFTMAAHLEDPDYKYTIPTLVQASKLDRTLPWEEHVPGDTWGSIEGPHIFFDLVTGGHFTYSDLCGFDLAEMAPSLNFPDAAEAIDDGCGDEAPDPKLALPLINQFAIGFFNGVLRNSPASFDYLTQAKADEAAPGVAEVQVDLRGLR